MRHSLTTALVISFCLAAAFGVEFCRSHAQRYFAETAAYEDIYYLPPNDILIAGSLGYRAALADVIWMKALIYYGEELGHSGPVRHLFRYGDALLALDPDFKRVYRWIANCAVYRTGTVTAEDVRAGIHYLELASRRFPDDGEIAWDLGANYTFELAPLLPAEPERAAARRKGLDYLEAAALRNAGPPWLVLQTANALTALGRNEQAIRHLEDVYATATDARVKSQIEQSLAALRSQSYAEALRRSRDELEAARARDFPYLDTTLYLLVGPRPAFGGNAWLSRGFDPARARGAEGALSD